MNISPSHIQGGLVVGGGNGNVLASDYISSYSPEALITSISNIIINVPEPLLQLSNDINNTGNIRLNSSTDATNGGINSLNITSTSGKLSLQNNSLSISNNGAITTINSTTDAVNSTTASLILQGGMYLNKSIIIATELSALDGYHSLVNNSIAGVLSITNQSVLGSSSIDFYDNNAAIKLKIGYGNNSYDAPLNGISYIESVNTGLLFRGNSTDSFIVNTDATVVFYDTTSSTSVSNASVVFSGGISINNTADATSISNGGSITSGGGISALKSIRAGLGFYTSTFVDFTKVSPIASPLTSTLRLYTDSNDYLLKSITDSGIITVYQPTNTKGDISVHNGTTQVRLPVGTDGYVIIADSSTATGLGWAQSITGVDAGVATTSISKSVYLDESYITQEATGAYVNYISPNIKYGASCNIFSSKSDASKNGALLIFNNNSSLTTNGSFDFSYFPYSGVYIIKDYPEGTGQYELYSSDSLGNVQVTLTGTVPAVVITNTFGCGFITVSSANGPSSVFIYAKSNPTLSTGAIATLVNSPGIAGSKLQLVWASNSSLSIKKTTNGDDGIYNITDIFQLSILNSGTVTLTGTSTSVINNFMFYQNKSFSICVFNTNSNFPCAVFTVSKNSYSRVGCIMTVGSPGTTSGEMLTLTWGAQQLLLVSKNGVNYDGVYHVYFSNIN